MIWRWATFFRLAAALAVASTSFGATVSGTVVLTDSMNASVKKQRDFSGVVVWLTDPTEHMSVASGRRAQMMQKDKRFSPHILAIQTGTVVDFPNFDPIFHNAFSNFNGKVFDVGLYSPGGSRSVRFDRAGIVRIFCNIHPSMSAIIVVTDSPHFAVTDASGRYVVNSLEPGAFEIHFFHERATPETLEHLEGRITVGTVPVVLPPVGISETGYLPAPHKNKYGREYPASPSYGN